MLEADENAKARIEGLAGYERRVIGVTNLRLPHGSPPTASPKIFTKR